MLLVEASRSVYLGAQAYLLDDSREMAWADGKSLRKHPTIRYLAGRYVEADNANSNGHVFKLEELENAQHDIAHTPLNMLHRPHYIVGHYIDAQLMFPKDEAGEGLSNPYVEAVAAFYRYYFPDEFAEVERAHKEGSLFYCVDDDTELMTADGWKRRSELVVGEDILTLNTATGLSEWTPLGKVNVFDATGQEVVHMESKMHSSVTTPNHRWWVERRAHRTRGQGSTWEWRTTESLTQETWIPRAVQHADFPSQPKHEDAFVEMAAWFWTEGTLCEGGGSVVYQSHAKNPQNCDRIAAALTKLYGAPARDGGLWYATDHGRIRYFHLSAEATGPFKEIGGKVIAPTFIRSLTESQLRLWVQISLDGDGDNAASGQLGIKQNSLEAQRTFEMACALLGIPTNTSLCKDGQWRVGVIRRSNRFNPVRDAQNRERKGVDAGMKIERRTHDGVVWCPTTPNGTFLARRRGTVYWTGNSMECVPKSVTCTAVCGQEFAYDGRTSPTYCFPAGQRVAMADGSTKAIEEVKIGDRVLTADGDGEVTYLHQRHYDGDLAKVYRRGSTEPIVSTGGHPFMAMRRDRRPVRVQARSGRWQEVAARDLAAGDLLHGVYPTATTAFRLDLMTMFPELNEVTPGRVQFVSKTGRRPAASLPAILGSSEALATILGFYLAEGSLQTLGAHGYRVVSFSLNVDEVEYADRIENALDKLGAGKLSRYVSGNRMECRVHNAALATVLSYLGGAGARAKRLAPEVMIAPMGFQREVLRAYAEGDGYLDASDSLVLRTASAFLPPQLRDLYARVHDVVPTLRHEQRCAGGPGNRGRTVDSWRLEVTAGQMSGRWMLPDDTYAVSVTRVEVEQYSGQVYNLEVAPQHTYVVDGISVHNCAHINQPGAVRTLNQPGFTGGALIIPPIKPGWKKADITEVSRLLRQHSEQAEHLYDDVRSEMPNASVEQWEWTVGQLLDMAYEDIEGGEWARDFNTAKRKQLAKSGAALPDGSYPIVTVQDLANAIRAYGRANPSDRAKVKAHIKKRAAALGATSKLPKDW
jgi:hypothetical protein